MCHNWKKKNQLNLVDLQFHASFAVHLISCITTPRSGEQCVLRLSLLATNHQPRTTWRIHCILRWLFSLKRAETSIHSHSVSLKGLLYVWANTSFSLNLSLSSYLETSYRGEAVNLCEAHRCVVFCFCLCIMLFAFCIHIYYFVVVTLSIIYVSEGVENETLLSTIITTLHNV